MRLSAVPVLAVCCFLEACDSDHGERRREWARLTHAINQVREAENAEKAKALGQIEQLSCLHFCQLRETCLSAYRLHTAAFARVASVQATSPTDEARGNPSLRSTLQEELTLAEREFGRARQKTNDCAALQGQLELER